MSQVNPWHQMPNMSDGALNLAESGAIIRYIANKYAPDTYGGTDVAKKAVIDWALEWMSTNFGKTDFSNIWYPVTGCERAQLLKAHFHLLRSPVAYTDPRLPSILLPWQLDLRQRIRPLPIRRPARTSTSLPRSFCAGLVSSLAARRHRRLRTTSARPNSTALACR